MPLKSEDAVKAIIAGSPYHIERVIKLITESLNKTREVEYHSFFADETDPEEIFTTVYTASLFSDTKAVLIHRAELLKNDSPLFSHLTRPTENSVIITTTDIKKGGALSKSLPGFELRAERKPEAGDATKEVIRIFAEKGLNINFQTAATISAVLDADLSAAEQEAEKLSLYYACKQNVTNQDILNHLNGEPHETMWNFIDSFMARKPEQCYRAFTRLPDREANASQIFYMLTMYFAWLYFKAVHPQLATMKNPLFNGKNYFIRSAEKNLRHWNPALIKEMIDLQRKLDTEIKTGQIETPDALLMLIHHLN